MKSRVFSSIFIHLTALLALMIGSVGLTGVSLANEPGAAGQERHNGAAGGGTKAPAQPAPPAVIKTEITNFENWSVTCRDFAGGKRTHVCVAQLQVLQAENKQAILVWSVFMDDDGKQVSLLQTPTGVSIAPGVEMKFKKGGPSHSLPFATCDTGNCVARIPLDSNLIHEISAGSDAEVSIVASNGNVAKFNFSTKGFDKAAEALGFH